MVDAAASIPKRTGPTQHVLSVKIIAGQCIARTTAASHLLMEFMSAPRFNYFENHVGRCRLFRDDLCRPSQKVAQAFDLLGGDFQLL